MALTASDLIAYACANRPTNDLSPGGGAIDSGVRPAFTQLSTSDDLEAFSSSGSDTSTLTITGRLADGSVTSQSVLLQGTTVVAIPVVFSVVFSIIYGSGAVGVILVRRRPSGATVCIIPAGEKGVSMLFANATSAAGVTVRYDKFFWKNVHGVTSLLTGVCRMVADPDARIRCGIATSVNDSATITNRFTPPDSVIFVDDNTDQSIPGGGTLAAGSAIGVWIELTLPSQDTEHKSTYTMQISGT